MSAAEPSPVLKQYLALHAEVPDSVLFFRMGDFYEMFYEDAQRCSDLLGITLTSRNPRDDNPVPMAGVPYHSAETYIAKLIAAGLSVAICEQVGNPTESKGPVERQIVRIVTPGTATGDVILDSGHNPWIWGWIRDGEQVGLAAVDFQTGIQRVGTFSIDDGIEQVLGGPASELVTDDAAGVAAAGIDGLPVSERPVASPTSDRGLQPLQRKVLGLVQAYLQETQKIELNHLRSPQPLVQDGQFALDGRTIRNLEIFRNLWDGSRQGTLFQVLNQTRTRMGERVLESALRFPLLDIDKIDERQAAIGALLDAPAILDDIRMGWRGVPDIARCIARLSQGTATPADLGACRDALAAAQAVLPLLAGLAPDVFRQIETGLNACADLNADLTRQLVGAPPRSPREGGIFADGINPELDELRSLAHGGAEELARIESREREATGIPKLKIGYNKVFGYYIEISNAHKDKVPAAYHRKQTLTNSERYITDELKSLEEKILGARESAWALEETAFRILAETARQAMEQLQRVADATGLLDMFCALAQTARERRWVQPMVHAGTEIEIVGGRHPALELNSDHAFVPNDCYLSDARRLVLITGPNMGGKSTFMRQVALIALLSQTGSYVPAESASIGLVDQIFTRVGASDALWRGQSTFMVEMEETADLIRRSTDRSLIILDEIGRGTSTFDGMSIAQAVVEDLCTRVRARTLFATHFHELADLDALDGIANLHVQVRMWEGKVVFLYTLGEGAASHSYGIEVASLAGVPADVLHRARTLLEEREHEELRQVPATPAEIPQMSLFSQTDSRIRDRLKRVDLMNTTPLDALRILDELVRLANGGGDGA